MPILGRAFIEAGSKESVSSHMRSESMKETPLKPGPMERAFVSLPGPVEPSTLRIRTA